MCLCSFCETDIYGCFRRPRTDGLYLRWAVQFQQWLASTYPLPGDVQPIPEDVPLPSRFPLRFRALESPTTAAVSEPANRPRSLPVLGSRVASVASNGRITAPEHFQDVRLLTLDLPTEQDGSSLELNPGDTITVFPSNHPEEAQAMIQFMGWEQVADAPIDWPACTKPPALHADDTFTLRDLLVHNLDITAVPRRSFLHKIAYFASDPDQKERLLEFTGPQFLDEYYDYTTRPRRTILEVLHEFSSVKVPPERALDTFPMIRGREFSIANGGDALRHPTDPALQRVELVVALVRYKTILRKERRGLCSRYLDGLAPGASIPVLHKRSLTQLVGPNLDTKPVVGVATGTGIAPIRSLLLHRASLCTKKEKQVAHGAESPDTLPITPPAHLFFGFRNQSADFHFSQDWSALSHFLTVHLAESRPSPPSADQNQPTNAPPGPSRRRYVQDVIGSEPAIIADMIRRGAIFLVCGGSHKMAEAVKTAVLAAIESVMGVGEPSDRDKVFEGINWVQEIW